MKTLKMHLSESIWPKFKSSKNSSEMEELLIVLKLLNNSIENLN